MRRLDNIDLRLLRVFVVLADAGGFFVYAVTVAVLLIKPADFYGRE